MKSRLSPSSLSLLSKIFKKNSIHIMHSSMYRSNTSGTVSALLAKVPIIICQVHNINQWDNKRQIFQDILLNPFRDKIIAVSQAVAYNYWLKTKCPLNKLTVIYNGVDTKMFSPAKDPLLWRRKYDFPEDKILIGTVARLVPQKGINFLLLSLKNIENLNWHLLIIGDGNQRNYLEQLAVQLKLHNKISFLGLRNDIPQLLKCLDFVVVPSLKEGFSNVILEAMATKLPVIATDVGGNSEAICSGENGILVKAKDIKSLSDAIRTLILNKTLRNKLANNALISVQKYSLQKMIENLSNLYISLYESKISKNSKK